MKAQNIKDALLIAVLLFVGWKTYQLDQIQPNVVTVTEYIPTTSTIVKTVPSVTRINGNDTIIYLTHIVRDTVRSVDTVTITAAQTIQTDTIDLDSLGYIAGMHIVNGSIAQSLYAPHVKQKTVTIRETFVKEPIRIYGNIQAGDRMLAPGITVGLKEFEAGYNWDIIQNKHYIRAGYRIFKLNN